MAETLEAFIKRQLRTVEDDGKTVAGIQLVPVEGDGTPFDSWYAPLRKEEGGPGPEAIAEEVMELCEGYADQFPKTKAVQFAVICVDRNGTERGRHLKQIFGRNVSSKGSAMLGGDMSIAEGARLHVETTKGLLNTMVANYNILGEQNRAQMEQNSALMYLLMNERLTRTAEQADSSEEPAIHPQVKYIMDKLVEASGPLAELIMNPPKRHAPPSPVESPAKPSNGASKPS